MIMAFCLQQKNKGNEQIEMMIAGNSHIVAKKAPQPMILAATMLRIPGFDVYAQESEEVYEWL